MMKGLTLLLSVKNKDIIPIWILMQCKIFLKGKKKILRIIYNGSEYENFLFISSAFRMH